MYTVEFCTYINKSQWEKNGKGKGNFLPIGMKQKEGQ